MGPAAGPPGLSVAEFKAHWEEVLEEQEIPEPECSVKWILEHVQRVVMETKV